MSQLNQMIYFINQFYSNQRKLRIKFKENLLAYKQQMCPKYMKTMVSLFHMFV